jgi:hypothetical protein
MLMEKIVANFRKMLATLRKMSRGNTSKYADEKIFATFPKNIDEFFSATFPKKMLIGKILITVQKIINKKLEKSKRVVNWGLESVKWAIFGLYKSSHLHPPFGWGTSFCGSRMRIIKTRLSSPRLSCFGRC